MKDDGEKMLADLLDRATSVEVCTIDQARGEHRRTRLSDEQMAILANAANAANTPSFNDAIEAAAKVAETQIRKPGRNFAAVVGACNATAKEISKRIRALALPAPGEKK